MTSDLLDFHLFNRLPKDILFVIFPQVSFDTKDYFRLSGVCRSWRKVSRGETCCKLAVKLQLSDEEDILHPIRDTLYVWIKEYFRSFEYSLRNKESKLEILYDLCQSGFEKMFIRFAKSNNIQWEECAGRLIRLASGKPYVGIVKLLLRQNVEINELNYIKKSAILMATSREGSPEVIYLLLQHGADVNQEDTNEMTPLLYASELGRVEVVKLLLEKGANVEKFDRTQLKTPLISASINGNTEVVELLLQYGANTQKRNHQKQRAIDVETSEEVKKLLLAYHFD